MKDVSQVVAVALPLPQNIAFGGRELLALKTMGALAALGVDARPLEYWDRSASFRAIHCFGAEGALWEIAARAQKQGKAVIVTPVLIQGRSILRERAWAHVDGLVPMRTSFRFRRDLLLLADAVVAQTHTEARAIRQIFGVRVERIHVIPNAVDPLFRAGDPALFRERYGAAPFVLAVGAIEARKGQLDLVRASGRVGKRLVIVGDFPERDAYGQAFAAAATAYPDLLWIRRLEEGSGMLASAYAAADAFVVSSRAEGLPLAALEAREAGAPLVMTDLPQHVEVFGAEAAFFRPGDVRSLAAILHGLRTRESRPRQDARPSWSWDDVGLAMRRVYQEVCPDLVPTA